jgi:hypothetical protein
VGAASVQASMHLAFGHALLLGRLEISSAEAELRGADRRGR